MGGSKLVCSLLFMGFAFACSAQESRYMVFYKDKAGTPFTIIQPDLFLSQRSISRRANQSISVTEQDLPVNPVYTDQINSTGANVLFSSRWFNGSLVEATASEFATIQSLNIVESVQYVAPGKNGTGGRRGQSTQTHADPMYASDVQNKMLGINIMHADGFRGEGLLIAVIDGGFTGVNNAAPFAHIFENNRLLDSYNFAFKTTDVFAHDDHGTEVLSTLAAMSSTFQGGAPQASYLLYISEYGPTEYKVEEYLWAFAAERADSAGVDIISSSLGYSEFDDPSMDYTYGDLDGTKAAISKAAQFAFERGIVVVNSAGNQYLGSDWIRITPPADGPNVLAVGSVNQFQTRATSSLIGPNALDEIKPDVMALGSGAAVVTTDGSVVGTVGTSFACPQIAGLVAGIWQMKPELTVAEMVDLIRQSGSRYFDPDNEYGYGIPTYQAAKNILEFPEQTDDILIYPNPVSGNTLNIGFDELDGKDVRLQLTSIMGQEVLGKEYKVNWQMNPAQLDVSILTPGVYLLRIEHGNKLRTFRVVKP